MLKLLKTMLISSKLKKHKNYNEMFKLVFSLKVNCFLVDNVIACGETFIIY